MYDVTPNAEQTADAELYNKLFQFITNPAHMRYGIYERVGSKALCMNFNSIMKANASFNHTFPRLMKWFIDSYPQYEITKKIMTEGVVYLRIGLVSDPPPKERRPPLTKKEQNMKCRDKNNAILDDVMISLCQITGWTVNQYQTMVSLGLVSIMEMDNVINGTGTIIVTEGNLFRYIFGRIKCVNQIAKQAKQVKEDFENKTLEDLILSAPGNCQRYTARLAVSEITYDTGSKLEEMLNRYSGTVEQLPALNYIVYPNIQQLRELSAWLKNNSKYQTELNMRRQHKASEFLYTGVPVDNQIVRIGPISPVEIKFQRILDVDTFIGGLPIQ